MASAHAKFSRTIESLWFNKLACVRRTTIVEGGSVRVYVCVLSCSKYKHSLQWKKLKTLSLPFPSPQTCC